MGCVLEGTGGVGTLWSLWTGDTPFVGDAAERLEGLLLRLLAMS